MTSANQLQPESSATLSAETTAPVYFIQDKIAERRFSPKEREMLDAFYTYTELTTGIDVRQADPVQSEGIALAANNFLGEAVERRIEQDAREGSKQRVYAIPSAPVERRIRDYYRQFGYDRQQKSGALLEAEETYLAKAKRSLFVKSYGGGSVDEEGVISPVTERYTRIELFPQVRFALKLEELLRAQGSITAANSLEALQAAYGGWFPENIQRLAASRMVRRLTIYDETDS